MTKKDKQTYAAIAAIIIVVIAIWFIKIKNNEPPATDQEQQNTQTDTDQSKTDNQQIVPITQASTWNGVLKKSDNEAKGSLMLVTTDHTVYLRTSRDFSSLVGKEVIVSYEGTLASFALKDIAAK